MKPSILYYIVKRTFDILASCLALIALTPILLITIIGIELSDPGPIFYMANRVGKNNKVFRMYKFRSMIVDDSANEMSLRPDQDRIYPFGRFMRQTKIDELPQLLNVLFGDMCVVGPRPASIDQLKITRGNDNAMVSSIKPGLTSPAALYDYLYGDEIEDEKEYMVKVAPTRLALDRFYVNNQSILYDLKLIWYTIECIVGKILHVSKLNILIEMIETVNGDMSVINEVMKKDL